MWNRRVFVSSLENLDYLEKLKVENPPEKVTERQNRSRGDRWIVGRRGQVFMEWNFGIYKVEWKVRLGWQQRKLATNGKNKNDGGRPPIDGFQGPSRRWRHRAEPQAKKETARKTHTCCMKTPRTRRQRRNTKDVTGIKIIKTGIVLKYNMTGMLTDERRYGNSKTKRWNDKNLKKKKHRNRQETNCEFHSWCT